MAKAELDQGSFPETLIFVSDDCRGEANQLPSFGFPEGSRLRPTRKISRSYYCVWKGSRLTAAEAILNSVHGRLVFGADRWCCMKSFGKPTSPKRQGP